MVLLDIYLLYYRRCITLETYVQKPDLTDVDNILKIHLFKMAEQVGFSFINLCTTCEGHLESSKHGIITPQCVDKMLSNNTFLQTRIQRLLDDYFFIQKGLCVHVQRMLKMSKGSYTGGKFKQNTRKKAKENWGPYLRSFFDKLTIWCQLIFY